MRRLVKHVCRVGGQSTGSARRRILLRFSSTWDVWIEHSKHITSNSGRRPNRNECKLSVWINGLVTYSTSVLPCVLIRHGTGSFGHPVNGSSFTSGSPGHHFDPVWDPSFSGYRKKCPKCKTYIWNAEMTKVIVRYLLLDWNHWMSVHAVKRQQNRSKVGLMDGDVCSL